MDKYALSGTMTILTVSPGELPQPSIVTTSKGLLLNLNDPIIERITQLSKDQAMAIAGGSYQS